MGEGFLRTFDLLLPQLLEDRQVMLITVKGWLFMAWQIAISRFEVASDRSDERGSII